jgi:phage terminase large subunit GpA-like protein
MKDNAHLDARQKRRPALAFMADVLAELVDVPPRMSPAEWAAAEFRVPDGPFAGQLWNMRLTPWWREPLDAMGPDSPVNKAVIKKGAQSGATVMALAYLSHSIVYDPCRMMVVQPTDAALTKFARGKLQPVIEKCEPLRKRVRAQTSRSASGSTTYVKAFTGGELVLAIATSPSDLSGDTIKKILKDEVDRYPDDVGGEGPPSKLIESRRKTFSITGDWKELAISTPTIKGSSEIDDEFERGDQRWWHVVCPDCSSKTKLVWEQFKFERKPPHRPHYVMQCCGVVQEERAMRRLLRNAEKDGGGWIPENPDAPFWSYHFDDITSPFESWENIARLAIEAEDDPGKEASFQQRTLARAYVVKTDTPDHTRLMELRSDWKRGHIPAWGLLLVASADVQMRGIYVEVLAIGRDRQSLVVEALFLDGDTADPERGAFAKLTEVYERTYPDAFGGRRRADVFGVDSGYRSNVVYTWCRNRQGAMALKGADGWARPALGTASLVDVDYNGKRVKRGATVWTVGTWPLKLGFYSDLRKEGVKSGAPVDPAGYCHFGTWLDEVYFRQLTAESVADETFKGRKRKVWKVRFGEENHFLDCRIYNLALAEYLGLGRMTADEWATLAKERAGGDAIAADLLSPAPLRIERAGTAEAETAPSPAPPAAPDPPQAAEPTDRQRWLGARRRGWLRQ